MKEMLQYLTKKTPEAFQEHWRPIYHLCHPCSVDYDYIGRFDRLKQDSERILFNAFGIFGGRLKFPSVVKSNTPNLVHEYLQNVTFETITNAMEIYRMDYEMFGYH